MAVEGIGNVIQNLSDHLFGQGPAAQAGTPIPGVPAASPSVATEDTFTSSGQNLSAQSAVQAAGIFQLNSRAVTGVAPGIVSAQEAPNLEQNAPPQSGNASGSDTTQSQPPDAAGAPTGTSPSSSTAAGQAAAGPAASAEIQNKIQQLNASLPALGLTNNEIQEIDRIASLIKDFNPAAYNDLVNQFEASSQTSTQNAQNSGSKTIGSAPMSGPGAPDQNTVGFQPQQILGPPPDSQAAASAPQIGAGPNNAINPNANVPPTVQAHGDQPAPTSVSNQNSQAPLRPH